MKWFIVNLAEVKPEDYVSGRAVVNLAIYTPDQLLNLANYRRPFTQEDKHYFSSRWQKACKENSHYRIKRGGEINSVDENYFDDYILSNIEVEYKPVKQVIGRILRDGSRHISDTTIQLNIKKMIELGKIEYQGGLTSMDTLEIRIIDA